MPARKGLPWWTWVPFLPVLFALLLLWRMRRRQWKSVNVDRPSIPLPDLVKQATANDLTMIKGIGPRSAAVLASAGITTFAQLAAAPVEDLRVLVESANLRILDPSTWPSQAAALAAAQTRV